MFNIGDYAVCSGHGVGQVVDIEKRELGSETQSFYVVKVISNGMSVMVPTASKEGIRKLVQSDDIEEVYGILRDHNVKVDNSTWNRRYRDYMAKIKTGSLLEIADVLRSLFLLKSNKNLSFGEKKMLEQCKNLLVEEISLSDGMKKNEIESRIDSFFSQ